MLKQNHQDLSTGFIINIHVVSRMRDGKGNMAKVDVQTYGDCTH